MDIDYATKSTLALFKAFELEQAGEWDGAIDVLFDRIQFSENPQSQAWDYFCQMSALILQSSGTAESLLELSADKDVYDPFGSAQIWVSRFIMAFSLKDGEQQRALFDSLNDEGATLCMAWMLRLTSGYVNKSRLYT
jgi:hypothetical protein